MRFVTCSSEFRTVGGLWATLGIAIFVQNRSWKVGAIQISSNLSASPLMLASHIWCICSLSLKGIYLIPIRQQRSLHRNMYLKSLDRFFLVLYTWLNTSILSTKVVGPYKVFYSWKWGFWMNWHTLDHFFGHRLFEDTVSESSSLSFRTQTTSFRLLSPYTASSSLLQNCCLNSMCPCCCR